MLNWYLETSEDAGVITTSPQNVPDLYMVNARITQFDESGEIQHQLNSARFTHYPLTDITTLDSPQVILFDAEEPPWHIGSTSGRIVPTDDQNEIVELWDEVVAQQHGENSNFIHIKTMRLTVKPASGYAETDQEVSIEDNTSLTTAASMQGFLNDGRFYFFSDDKRRVKTTIWPRSE